MASIIDLQAYRRARAPAASNLNSAAHPAGTSEEITSLSEQVETMLTALAQDSKYSHTVALAAGRFAAMQLFQLHGRAASLAYIDDCLQTAEICEDILRQMDEDYQG